jgi:hypothetical protein
MKQRVGIWKAALVAVALLVAALEVESEES